MTENIREQKQKLLVLQSSAVHFSMGGDFMKRRIGKGGVLGLMALCGVFVLAWSGTALAQRRPQSSTPPSVTSKAALRGAPGDYVGSEICAGCHTAEGEEFAKTPHAVPAEKAEGKEGAKAMTTVTGCEACHGPGKAHAEHQMEAAGDPAKEAEGAKLIYRFDGNPKENSERCLVCHDSGKPQAGFGHSMHLAAGVSCEDCHSAHLVHVADIKGGPGLNPGPVQFTSAQGQLFQVPKLKEETRWLNNSLLKESQPALCFSCHQTVQGQFSLPEHHRVPEGFMKCTDCHNPHGSSNHFNLTKASWETCVTCHVEKRGPFVYEHAVVRTEGCVSCHTPHGSVNNFLLKRREQRLLCLQCHSVVHIINPTTTTGLNGQANVPHGRGGYQGSGPCTRCHVAVHGSNFDEYLLK